MVGRILFGGAILWLYMKVGLVLQFLMWFVLEMVGSIDIVEHRVKDK